MGDKTIEIGDFLFEEKKYDFEKLWNDIYYKNSNKKYEDRALELMRLHYEFFRIINDLKECEAVLRGAKIVCTHGNHPIFLDIYEDHGVYDKNTPVMSCADCKTGQNIYSFGACGNDKFEPVYSDMVPPPKELMKDNRGNERYKCLPIILDGVWGLGDENSRSIFFYALARQYNLVFGQEWEYDEKDLKKALKKRKNMKNKEEYVKILMSNANILCLYGGIITVVENAEIIEDVVEEVEEEEKIKYIEEDGWLKLYFEPTVPENGRFVEKHPKANNYDWGMEEELKGEHTIDWFETASPAYQYITQRGSFDAHKLDNGLYVDGEGRYWVAVGPNVVNPNHSKEKRKTSIDVSETFPGTKMDVMVQCEKDGIYKGEVFYIPIVIGDAKEHSYPDGLYQTGIPFNKDRGEYPKGAGNTVEFIGYDIQKKLYEDNQTKSCVNITNNYRILGIIVYDGVFNY